MHLPESNTYDPNTEQFNAAAGATVTSIQKASSESSYSGSGTHYGSGSITWKFSEKQSQSDTTTWKVANKKWTQQIASSGSYSDNEDYVSNSSGTYTTKIHNLPGNWSLVNKDGGTTNTNWSSNYAESDGAWKYTGSGVMIGYASQDYDKSASGAYTDGIKEGTYSETFKSDSAAGLLIILSRAGADKWIGTGAIATSASGSVDISDKWTSVEVEAAHNHYGDETTTTDSDSGQHFDYQVSTAQGLWKNGWRAETGTGTGSGSGWAHLTVATRGTFTDWLLVDASPFIKTDGSPLILRQLSGTITGDSSDKLDYTYKNTFTLTTAGWTTSETGSGTWKKTDHNEKTVNGSILEIGAQSVLLDLGAGGFKYIGFAALANSTINDSTSDAVFSWSDDRFTMTENTTTSSSIENHYESGFYGLMFGSGNGWAESHNFLWTKKTDHSGSGSSETTKTYTVDHGNIEWSAKYSSDSETVTTGDLDRVSHYGLILRRNEVIDGVRDVYKSDSYGVYQLYSSSNSGSESHARWESSSDGTSPGSKIDTYDSSSYSGGSFSEGLDTDYFGMETKWNSAGIVIYQSAWAGDDHFLEAGSFSTIAVFSSNPAGLQPTFMLDALGAKGIYARFTLQGAGAAGTSSFGFSIQAMTFDAGSAISRNQLPDVTLATTDFDQIGQGPDTRTFWQKLKDLVVIGIETASDKALETAVWIVDQVGAGVRYVGNFVSEYSTEILDGIQLALDFAGFIPGLGAIPDLLNAGIHAARGNYGEMAMSLAAAVPGVGDAIKATSMGTKAIAKGTKLASSAASSITKAASKFKNVGKIADKASDASKSGKKAAEALAKGGKKVPACNPKVGGGCFVAGTLVHIASLPQQSGAGFQPPSIHASSALTSALARHSIAVVERNDARCCPIESIPLGARISDENPILEDYDFSLPEFDADTWQKVNIRIFRADGAMVDMELLRPAEWIAERRLYLGGPIDLFLEELEIDGRGIVTSIGAADDAAEGDGNVVTGRFVTYEAGNLVTVRLENGSIIQGTRPHPIWSVTRGEWVPLAELQPCELLDSNAGPVAVEYVTPTSSPADVYNIEVHGHHVYRIAGDGILVHNAGGGNYDIPKAPRNAKPSLDAHKKALKDVHSKVGKLPKGKPGKFGSPQAGTPKKGYRLDPPHPNAKAGTPEAGYHFNWWDWTMGKGTGGRFGAILIGGLE